MKKQPTPPDEFCPECMSLKRKPNKECVNHEKYWIHKAPHLIEITKEKKKYIVRCVGDYADIVVGRSTAYEFSEEYTTFKEAIERAKEFMEYTKMFYKLHKKKAHIRFVENI